MRRQERGFWLSEVLTSLWLIAFVGAAMLGLFAYLSKTSKIANERAAAELLADRLMEKAVRIGPPDWGLASGQIGVALQEAGHENNVLTYTLNVSELEEHRLGKLFLLQVAVEWKPADSDSGQVERGRGLLTRERQVYLEDFVDAPAP